MSYQLFDALPRHIEDALRASIERFGVLVPITVDQDGNILDGHHRKRIADELEVPYDRLVRVCDSDDERREIARTLNADRRQLSDEQRREVAAELRGQGHSYRAIGGALGVSHEQARKDVAASSTVNDLTVDPDRITGLDGRSRPARRPQVMARDDREQKRAQSTLASTPDITSDRTLGVTDLERRRKDLERDQKREQNRALVEQATPLPDQPDRRYSTIVIDPPWDWGDEGDHEQLGRARPTYDTMSYDEILAMPVGAQAERDAHLYLWITNRSLHKGFTLIEAWGFRYITALTWCKPHFGMGNYFRGQTEHVLFGVRGSLPLLRRDRGTWFAAARGGEHSGKPAEFYQLVEECSPGPWLEVFGRGSRPGWSVWGAEAS